MVFNDSELEIMMSMVRKGANLLYTELVSILI